MENQGETSAGEQETRSCRVVSCIDDKCCSNLEFVCFVESCFCNGVLLVAFDCVSQTGKTGEYLRYKKYHKVEKK